MTLSDDEFIRRFLLHVIPPGFQRIRYYGLFSNRYRVRNLARCRELLVGPRSPLLPDSAQLNEFAEVMLKPEPPRCPKCKLGVMVRVLELAPILWPNVPSALVLVPDTS